MSAAFRDSIIRGLEVLAGMVDNAGLESDLNRGRLCVPLPSLAVLTSAVLLFFLLLPGRNRLMSLLERRPCFSWGRCRGSGGEAWAVGEYCDPGVAADATPREDGFEPDTVLARGRLPALEAEAAIGGVFGRRGSEAALVLSREVLDEPP